MTINFDLNKIILLERYSPYGWHSQLSRSKCQQRILLGTVNPNGCANELVYAVYHQDEPSNTLRFFPDRIQADHYVQHLRHLLPGSELEEYTKGYKTIQELKQSTKQTWEEISVKGRSQKELEELINTITLSGLIDLLETVSKESIIGRNAICSMHGKDYIVYACDMPQLFERLRFLVDMQSK